MKVSGDLMLLSIIIPAYNLEQYISKCFDRLLPELNELAEVIVIDDGSTDQTYEICKRYEAKYSFMHCYHKENGGVSSARNYGLQIAKGDYIAWVDGDDIVTENWYRKIIDVLQNEKPDMIIFDLGLFWDDGKKKLRHARLPRHLSTNEFIYELSKGERVQGFFWNKVLKRAYFNHITIDENIFAMEDYKVITQIASQLKKIVTISEVLYWYRQRSESLTHDRTKELELYQTGIILTKENYNRQQKEGRTVSDKGWLFFVVLYL